MTLVIVHYHLRPGGIRRVIELATPHVCRRLGNVKRVLVASGEAADTRWNAEFARQLKPIKVEFVTEAGLGYVSEQKGSAAKLRSAVATAVQKVFAHAGLGPLLVWAHNLGVGRNLILTRELTTTCERRGAPLIAHHHDWWFDDRWARWSEIRRTGFATLNAVAETIFPQAAFVRHAAINSEDATILKHHLADHSAWVPNLADDDHAMSGKVQRQARIWLDKHLGEADAPVWILPCRMLRRKNMAEAMLLTRWLRPEAWLVTTGGVSSREERAYFQRLDAMARKRKWRVRFGILANGDKQKPSVAALLAASECVLLTSIREGFGLPYLEAASAKKPLIARRLSNIAPDLADFGFRFPQSYEEILVHTDLFNWERERQHQLQEFRAWRKRLPPSVRKLAPLPALPARRNRPVAEAFSRLSLTAQLEVLAQPLERTWELCAPLNPFLEVWRRRASTQKLEPTAWPKPAGRILSGAMYAENLLQLVQPPFTRSGKKADGAKLQMEFIRKKLAPGNTYPLLWKSDV